MFWKDLLKSRPSPYREKPFDDAKPELPSPQDDIRPPSPDRVSVMEVVEDLLREEGGAADFDKIFEAVENKASNIVSRKEVMAILEYDPDVAQLEDGDYILVNTIEKNWQDILQKEGKKDACYYKVKSRYKKWPSAYASGALVQCRKVGAKNWGNSVKKGGDNFAREKKEGLHGWFSRRGGGGQSGWVSCQSCEDDKEGTKPCGRKDASKGTKQRCRPTCAACKTYKRRKGSP